MLFNEKLRFYLHGKQFTVVRDPLLYLASLRDPCRGLARLRL